MLLPYGLVNILQKLRYSRYYKYSSLLKKNITLKGKYNGKRCFVIGNGPSINNMNLAVLENEYVYIVNDFVRHKDINIIKPTFYSAIEPFKTLYNYPSDHPYNIYNYFSRIDNALSELDVVLLLLAEYKDFILKNNFFKNKNIFYLASGNSILTNKLNDDITKPNSFMMGVVFSAICNCAYMGFNEIYFIGCDCDYFIRKNESHFYNIENINTEFFSNEAMLFDSYSTLKYWRITREHFEKKGYNIINAGINGENDTCKRVNFADLFHQ